MDIAGSYSEDFEWPGFGFISRAHASKRWLQRFYYPDDVQQRVRLSP